MRAPIPVLVMGDTPDARNVEHLMSWDAQDRALCGAPFESFFAPKQSRASVVCAECFEKAAEG